MGHEKLTWWHMEIQHKSFDFKAPKVSAHASGHAQKEPGTQVLPLPSEGPVWVPSAQACACLLSTVMQHAFLRQVTLIIDAGGSKTQAAGSSSVSLWVSDRPPAFVFFIPPLLLHICLSFSTTCPADFRLQLQLQRQQPYINPLTTFHNCERLHFYKKTVYSLSGSLSLVEVCLIPSKFQKRICHCSWYWG